MKFTPYDLIVVAGPTGIGKTRLGIEFGLRCSGKIISADSRQIYRYLDIGTAKPTHHERTKIDHFQVDIIDPDQVYDASQFAEDSEHIIRYLQRRNVLPLVVGGSGLYIRALVDGLFEGPSSDPALRETLNTSDSEKLFQTLQHVDPNSAQRIHPNDQKRIVRALEVYYVSGKTLTTWHAEQQAQPPKHRALFIGLHQDRADLYRRIEQRVDYMVKSGLFEETEHLLNMGFTPDLNALNTIGYQESIRYVQGELSRDEAIEAIKQNSRRYAKRQLTWFRAEERMHWFDVGELALDEIVNQVKMLWEQGDRATCLSQ